MKLGFPRALFYYDYYPFWAGFFREMGIELVSSIPTNRTIMEQGLKKAPTDTCLPIKILVGHLQTIKGVDAVFLPRLVSMEEKTYLCPKMLGIPESIMGTLPAGLEVLTADVNWRSGARPVRKSLIEWGKTFGKGKQEIVRAFDEGMRWLKTYHEMRSAGWSFQESMECFENLAETEKLRNLGFAEKGKIIPQDSRDGMEQKRDHEWEHDGEYRPTIALVGHSYLTYETYANLNLPVKLAEKANVRVVETVPPATTLENQKKLRKSIFWSHARKIYGAGESFLENPEVDGIIYLSCFGCGTDSMTNDLLTRRAKAEQKPYLVITLDEHTGEAGLVTRLEAFLDMLERRIRHEDHVPAYGECLDRHTSAF